MVEGANDPSQLAGIPAEIGRRCGRSLAFTAGRRWIAGNSESMQALAAENAALETEARAYASATLGEGHEDKDFTKFLPRLFFLKPRVTPGCASFSGSVQIAQSAGRVRKLAVDEEAGGQPTETSGQRWRQSTEPTCVADGAPVRQLACTSDDGAGHPGRCGDRSGEQRRWRGPAECGRSSILVFGPPSW